MKNNKYHVIAAACRTMGIGKNGQLPWRLKKEMAYFNRITTTTSSAGLKNAVIMGRKTWFSIPPSFRPLKDRINVVLSCSMCVSSPEGADYVAKSLDEALSILSSVQNLDQVFVIGGENVYKEAVQSPNCKRIYLTRIDADFECDTFFPSFDTVSKFALVSDTCVPSDAQEEGGLTYRFEVYENVLDQ